MSIDQIMKSTGKAEGEVLYAVTETCLNRRFENIAEETLQELMQKLMPHIKAPKRLTNHYGRQHIISYSF